MKLELRKATDGTHFVICVVGERVRRQIVVPLSPELSGKIQQMVDAEGVKTDTLILPPGMARQ